MVARLLRCNPSVTPETKIACMKIQAIDFMVPTPRIELGTF